MQTQQLTFKLLASGSHTRLSIILQSIALAASVLAITAGGIVSAAWILALGKTTDAAAVGSNSISPATAVSFIVAGTALILLNRPTYTDLARKAACVLAVLLMLFATAQLIDGGVHGTFNDILTIRFPQTHTWPIAVQAIMASLFIGSGILWASTDNPRYHVAAQVCALPVIVISTLGMIGYTYGFDYLQSTGFPSQLPFTTAGVLEILGVSLLLSRPNIGPISILTSDTFGGVVARRLMPIYFLMQLLGLISSSNRNSEIDLLFIVLLATFGFPVFVWLIARALERTENEKIAAYDHVQVLNKQLNHQVEELVESQSQITEALKARSEFLAKVSHELRTPLSGMIGTTELLLGMQLDNEQRELAVIALDSANTLLALINEILDFSKIDARQLQIEKIDFDLNALLETAIQIMRAKAEKKNLALISFISPDLERRVCGDPGRLRQIVMNLIDNAIKFTDQGRILLQVSIDDDTEHIRFAITDTGIGLSEEQSAKLFQPFVQADGSTTRRYGGTGLGLSICKNLVELMGGKIGIQSAPGKGSTVWFAIPLEKSSPMVKEAEEKDPQLITTTMKRSTILLVEDNPVNAKLATLQLKRLGYLVDVAGTGREAVNVISKKRYALVLMDIQMPDMDGLEATALIREMELTKRQHLPIVATTAHAMPGDREKCIAAGMDDYVTKPLSLALLASTCKRWITMDETTIQMNKISDQIISDKMATRRPAAT